MKGKVFLSTIFLFSFSASAESELEQKAKALSVLKKYTETVACGTSFEENTSLESFLNNTFVATKDHSYYILWQGDVGCAGGSGTTSFYVSEVGRDTDSRPFLVREINAFGSDFTKNVNTRFIESIQAISPLSFSVVSYEHSDGDANNFPSLKFKYYLERSSEWDSDWKVKRKENL